MFGDWQSYGQECVDALSLTQSVYIRCMCIYSAVRMAESGHKRSIAPTSGGEQTMSLGTGGVSALCFLQCFDTVC